MLLRSKPGFTSQSVHSLRSIKQRLVVPKIMFGNYSLIWFWPNPCRWGQTWMPLPSHFLPFSPLRYPSACRQLACLAEQQQFWAVPQPSRFGLYVQSMWTHGWQQVFYLILSYAVALLPHQHGLACLCCMFFLTAFQNCKSLIMPKQFEQLFEGWMTPGPWPLPVGVKRLPVAPGWCSVGGPWANAPTGALLFSFFPQKLSPSSGSSFLCPVSGTILQKLWLMGMGTAACCSTWRELSSSAVDLWKFSKIFL